jgi:hypothetical protein
VTRLKWNLDLVRLELVLILMQDRHTLSAECTTSSEIILDTLNVTTRWVVWNIILVQFEIVLVLVLVQDRCTVCAKHTIGSESFWMPAMVVQGDEAQVEAGFSPFGYRANLDAR